MAFSAGQSFCVCVYLFFPLVFSIKIEEFHGESILLFSGGTGGICG